MNNLIKLSYYDKLINLYNNYNKLIDNNLVYEKLCNKGNIKPLNKDESFIKHIQYYMFLSALYQVQFYTCV